MQDLRTHYPVRCPVIRLPLPHGHPGSPLLPPYRKPSWPSVGVTQNVNPNLPPPSRLVVSRTALTHPRTKLLPRTPTWPSSRATMQGIQHLWWGFPDIATAGTNLEM